MGDFDEIIYCPRCGGPRPYTIDASGKRGECQDCRRTSCGPELEILRAMSPASSLMDKTAGE